MATIRRPEARPIESPSGRFCPTRRLSAVSSHPSSWSALHVDGAGEAVGDELAVELGHCGAIAAGQAGW
jgi:hypothetical protein